MAIVNGELGLHLAGNSLGKMITYAATGGVVMILYFVIIAYTVLKKKKDEEAGELELILTSYFSLLANSSRKYAYYYSKDNPNVCLTRLFYEQLS